MADDYLDQRSGGTDIHGDAHIAGDVAGRDVTKHFNVRLDRPIELHGSRVLPRNTMFVGRAKTLSELADRLADEHALVILTGYGGLSKTQTAIEFAHRYIDRFPGGVFWLSCAQPDLIGSEIAACGSAGRLTLPGYDELPQPEKVNLVLGAWQQPIARLLIFDNAEAASLLTQWRPTTGGCRVLVTARRAEWPRTLTQHVLALPALERADSLALLAFGRADFPRDDAAQRLAEKVGDLPLALHVAGAYMNHYGLTPQEYLAECEQLPSVLQHEALQDWLTDELPTTHTPNVIKTFEVSYRALTKSHPSTTRRAHVERNAVKSKRARRSAQDADDLALRVFHFLAHVAPAVPLPREVLLQATGLADDATGGKRLTDALHELSQVGLVMLDPSTGSGQALRPSTHRLLQEFARLQVDEARFNADAAQLEEGVGNLATEINQAGLPKAMEPLLPHLQAVAEHAAVCKSENASWLFVSVQLGNPQP